MSVETETNQKKGSSYAPLENPTSAQLALVNKYDNPGTQSAGSIPFIDFGNKFVISGATYKPDVLKGHSFDEIAAAATDPTTDIGKGVLGAANTMTAAICEMTGGKPGTVCDTPVITKLPSHPQCQKGLTAEAAVAPEPTRRPGDPRGGRRRSASSSACSGSRSPAI